MARPSEIDLSVVIMAFDEEDNLPVQVERTRAFLRAECSDWQIVIVDDGSRDRTGDVADAFAAEDPEHVTVVHHGKNRGMGAAIKSGYGVARCGWITQLPADCQVDPRVFARFFEHLDRATIVLSVYARREDGALRKVLSWGFQRTVKALLGHRGDYTGTMMFRRELLEQVGPLVSDTFFVNMELPIKALRLGVSHAEVTIEAQPRLSGRSKVAGARKIALVAREIAAMRLRDLRGEGPR